MTDRIGEGNKRSRKRLHPSVQAPPRSQPAAALIPAPINPQGALSGTAPYASETSIMPTKCEPGPNVPAFLVKLWRLVENEDSDDLICWSDSGESFIIKNKTQFERELLPQNYKHNNMASFIRQLNMYGFHKVASPENGGLRFDRDEVEFQHSCFRRHCVYLLEHIKRKISVNPKTTDETVAVQDEVMNKINKQVKILQTRTDKLEHSFVSIKHENATLWREIINMRKKHDDQKKFLGKLCGAIAAIAQHVNIPVIKPTQRPLMIHDNPDKSRNARSTSNSGAEHAAGDSIEEESISLENLLTLRTDDSDIAYKTATYADEGSSPLHNERPQSSASIYSHHSYDYTNQNADNIVAGSIGESDTCDEQLYHVTEYVDERSPVAPMPVEDNNVLRTPLVRQREATSRALKEQNTRARKRLANVTEISDDEPLPKFACGDSKIAQVPLPKPISVKLEPDGDNSLFGPFHDVSSNDPILISPNSRMSEDIQFSNVSNDLELQLPTANLDTSNENFLPTDLISPDLFQDATDALTLGNEDSDLYTLDSALNNGRFANILHDNAHLAGGNQRPESEPAGGNAVVATVSGNNAGSSTSKGVAQQQKRPTGGKNMAVARYLASKPDDRLSTVESFNSELNSVQRDLENIKDWIANHNTDNSLVTLNDPTETLLHYNHPPSLGASDFINNILFNQNLEDEYRLKLFASETDLFNSLPYPSQFDAINPPSGSELMTYQPSYDLGEYMNIQDEDSHQPPAAIDIFPSIADNLSVQPSKVNVGTSQFMNTGSELNTPYHDSTD